MRPPEMVRQCHQICATKVQIFENEKDEAGGDDTDHQAGLLSRDLVFPLFNKNACWIIYRNGYQQNKNIFWNKPHIEEAAGGQQEEPAELMRQQIKQQGDYWKEDQKFYRVEEHSAGLFHLQNVMLCKWFWLEFS